VRRMVGGRCQVEPELRVALDEPPVEASHTRLTFHLAFA